MNDEGERISARPRQKKSFRQKDSESGKEIFEPVFLKYLDQIPELIAVLNFRGNILFVNRQMRNVLGYGKDELEKSSFFDIECSRSPEFADRFMEKKHSGISLAIEGSFRRKNGSILPVEIHLSPLSFRNQENDLFCLARDITSIRSTLDALIENEAMLNETQEIAHIGSMVWDLLDDSVAFSANMLTLTGLKFRKHGRGLTDRFISMIDERDRKRVIRKLFLMVKKREAHSLEFRINLPDDRQRIWQARFRLLIDEQGVPQKLIGVQYDITSFRHDEIRQGIMIGLLQSINSQKSLQKVLDETTATVQEYLQCEEAAIRLRDGENFRLHAYRGTAGFSDNPFSPVIRISDFSDPQSEDAKDIRCFCTRIITRNTDPCRDCFTLLGSFWTNDFHAACEPEIKKRNERLCRKCGLSEFVSVMIVPILHDNETIGLIQLGDRHRKAFDPGIVRFIEQIAGNIASGIIRRKTESSLRESEQLFREIFYNMANGVAIYEVRQNGEEFIFKDLNPAGLRGGQKSREEVIGRRVQDVFPGVIDLGLYDVFGRVWKTGIPEILPTTQYKDNRIAIWVENYVCKLPSGEIIAVYSDITDQKKNEEARIESETRSRSIVDNSPIGLIQFRLDDNGNLVFMEANPKAGPLLAHEKSWFSGKYLDEIFPLSAESEILDLCRQSAAGGISWKKEELPYYGSHADIFLDVFGFQTVHGQMALMFQDVTEKKRSNDRIQTSLKEKEVLLQEIHHRVKNNLQMISSLLNLQSIYTQNSYELGGIKDASARIRSMGIIHERLYRSGNLSSIDFEEYVKTLIDELFNAYSVDSAFINCIIRTNRNVRFNIDTAIPCGLILNEIITNSLKYAFPDKRHGIVTVSLTDQGNDCYSLTISDNGIGLPRDVSHGKKHGLGLELIRILSQQLGGKLTLRNRKGTHYLLSFQQVRKEEKRWEKEK